jgi:hypothetical protein
MNWHLWTKSYERHRLRIGGSGAETIVWNGKGTLLRHQRENSREPEPGDILREHPAPRRDRAGTKPFATHVCSAHAQFVAVVAGAPPRAIPLDTDAVDLEDRVDHLSTVLNALSVYLTVILDDTAKNIPGRVDFGDISAALSDLASDVTGTIQLAADAMAAGRVA